MPKLHIPILPTLQGMKIALKRVDAFWAHHGFPPTSKFPMVIEEIVANIIANRSPSSFPHKIILIITVDKRHIYAKILDNGRPFNPLKYPAYDSLSPLHLRPVGGLGIHFIKSFIDKISYKRLNAWNCLHLFDRIDKDVSPLQDTRLYKNKKETYPC